MTINTQEINKLLEFNPFWEIRISFKNTKAITLEISEAKTKVHIFNIIIHDSSCALEDKNEKVILISNFSKIVEYLTMSKDEIKKEIIKAVQDERYVVIGALVDILKYGW